MRLTRIHGLLAVAIIAALWSLVSAVGLFREDFFPSLAQVWRGATGDWSRLVRAAGSSLTTALVGYLVGFGTAVLVGMFIGWYDRADRWLSGAVDYFRAIPAVAIIPLALLIFKEQFLVGVVAVAWACFFVTVINVIVGIRHISRTLESAVRSFGGRDRHVLVKVAIPSLLPYFLASLRQNVSVALIVIVVTDMFLALTGLGSYILSAQGTLRYDRMYAAIVFISVVGYGAYKFLGVMERRLFPWWSEEREGMLI